MTAIQIASLSFIGAGLVGGTATIVGASVYDLRYAYQKKQKRPLGRPLISVIVPCNSIDGLQDCISSLVRSSVRKYEIIIVGNSLSKEAQQQIRKLIKSNSGKSLRLVKATKSGDVAALKTSMRTAKGELVVLLEPRFKVNKDALKKILEHFSINETPGGFRLDSRTTETETLSSLLQQYEGSTRSQALKLADITNLSTRAGINSTFRRHELAKSLRKNKLPTVSYASNSLAYSMPASSLGSLYMNRYWAQPEALKLAQLAVPVAFGYFTFLAASHRSTSLLVLSWLVSVGFLLMAIVGDESLTWKKKIKLAALMPVAFVLFLMSALASSMTAVRLMVNALKKLSKIRVVITIKQ